MMSEVHCFFFLCCVLSAFLFHFLHPFHIFTFSSYTSPFSLLSPHHLSSSVWYYRWWRSQRGFDGAQPTGCPTTLSNEWCGPARVCWSAGHAGWRSLLQPGCGHCSGHGQPLPRYVHQHRLVKEEKGANLFSHTSHIVYISRNTPYLIQKRNIKQKYDF